MGINTCACVYIVVDPLFSTLVWELCVVLTTVDTILLFIVYTNVYNLPFVTSIGTPPLHG